jgi:hypothetical protein
MRPLINVLKSSAKSIIPERFHPLEAYKRGLKARAGGRVLNGPFRGMLQALPMCDETGPGGDILVSLGVYERELHGVVEEACSLNPRLVVNVGGYRGYYAVGLGLRLPQAAVVAYETVADNQRYIRVNAEQNGLTNFKVFGQCGTAELRECLESCAPGSGDRPGSVLVVCDIEGAERSLMDPTSIPRLRDAAIILEVHGQDIRDLMMTRFAASHHLTYFPTRAHSRDDFPYQPWYVGLSDPTGLLAERQIVDGFGWLWMRPEGCVGKP